MAEDDRRNDHRQQDIWKNPTLPRRPSHTSARVGLAAGEVLDQLVEIVVRLRCQGACDSLVELLVVDTSRQMLPAEYVPDRLALRVANPKLPVLRTQTTAVIRHDSLPLIRLGS